MSIQAIDRTSVHRLTSGQVVVDLQTAVKELVENALDAGANSIEITFRDSGVESIEVKDNGKGIDQADWEGIALKHHTSKLASFADLAAVQTLGFRGEALSSLCGVATLSMITSTAATAPMGTILSFTSAGACVPQKRVARERGTTVKVERLFDTLPVRRKELVKNAQRELGKALALIQAYAIVNSGVRFEARNVTKGKTLVQLKTTASTSLRTSFSCIFAPKDLPSLLDLDLSLEVATEKSVMKRFEGGIEPSTRIRVKGLISKPLTGHGRTAGNRQFYYINGRPFQPAKIAKAVNEVYKSFNANQLPTVIADFQLATDAYDVNVSPDKRTIFLHSEGNLLAALKQELARFYHPQQGRFEMKVIGPVKRGGGKGKERAVEEDEPREREDDAAVADDERPRKRRKSCDTPALDSSPAPSASEHPGADTMDIDLDTTALTAASSAHASPSLSQPLSGSNDDILLAAFPDLPDEQIHLPDPPSPLKRALSPSASRSETPRSRSPSAEDDERDSPEPPLFRAPTPRAQLHPPPPPHSHSPSPLPRSPSPAAAAPLAKQQLRQPTLSFAGAAGGAVRDQASRRASGARGRKGAAPQKVLQSHLRRFLRGGQAAAETEEEREEEEDDDAEEEQEEEIDGADDERDEVDELEEPAVTDHGGGDGGDATMTLEESPPAEGAGDVREADDADDRDAVLVVEDSYRAPSPSLAGAGSATQAAEMVAASCVCVHGSQSDDDEDDADSDVLEISEQAPPPPLKVKAGAPPATLPFGAAPAEVAGTVVATDAELAFDFNALSAAWAPSPSSPIAGFSPPRARAAGAAEDELAGAAVGEREDAAEATLSRVVSKDDFARMEVVGQFNLGFIIARRRVRAGATADGSVKGKERAVDEEDEGETHDDLFIVDQHASDEKYNFEKLQADTVIQSQRLLAPRILNLPSADELMAMEHVDLLRVNGYDVLVDEDADVGERVKLIAQPVSKETVFDTGDFEELVDLIGSRSGNEVVRPSKAWRMFASRACRKSVMIGKALNVKQMTQILRHMGEMDQPWACPHGRPTMRWLAGLPAPAAADSRLGLSLLYEAYA